MKQFAFTTSTYYWLISAASNQRLQCVILHIWQKALMFILYRSHLYDVQLELICFFKNTHMITHIHQWTRISLRILKAYPITKIYERLDEIRSHLLLKGCSWTFLLLKNMGKNIECVKSSVKCFSIELTTYLIFTNIWKMLPLIVFPPNFVSIILFNKFTYL